METVNVLPNPTVNRTARKAAQSGYFHVRPLPITHRREKQMKRSERAMQVWQILIAAAHNRQSLTYGHVAQHLEFEGAGVLSQILDRIMHYCKANGLPPLTCLVVNQETGIPGSGLSTVSDLPRDREAVYQRNWFALPPVQVSDFESEA